jgi:hypothetical protein
LEIGGTADLEICGTSQDPDKGEMRQKMGGAFHIFRFPS